MTLRIKRLYQSAIKNERFLKEIYEADGDKKPSFFAPEKTKVIFATIYYGWMVCEHGVAWELHL